MSAARQGFYVTAGTIARNAPSYVVRAADDALYQALSASEYCYVLTSRQMGKSSLMIHTVGRLQAEGISAAIVDLTALGFNLDADQWYNSLSEQLGSRLKLRADVEDFAENCTNLSPLQRWMKMIREVFLERITGQIVIFLDEIDTLVSAKIFATCRAFQAHCSYM